MVAQGRSPPIMITDDHKPSRKQKHQRDAQDDEEVSDQDDSDASPPPPRKKANTRKTSSRGQVDTGIATPPQQPSPPQQPLQPFSSFQQPQQQQQQQYQTYPSPSQQLYAQGQPALAHPSQMLNFFPSNLGPTFLFPPASGSSLPSPMNIKTPSPITPPTQLAAPSQLASTNLAAEAQLLANLTKGHPSSQQVSPIQTPEQMRPAPALSVLHHHHQQLSAGSTSNSPAASPRPWGENGNGNGDHLRPGQLEQPVIKKVIPSEGRIEGKTEVVILGTGFFGT